MRDRPHRPSALTVSEPLRCPKRPLSIESLLQHLQRNTDIEFQGAGLGPSSPISRASHQHCRSLLHGRHHRTAPRAEPAGGPTRPHWFLDDATARSCKPDGSAASTSAQDAPGRGPDETERHHRGGSLLRLHQSSSQRSRHQRRVNFISAALVESAPNGSRCAAACASAAQPPLPAGRWR